MTSLSALKRRRDDLTFERAKIIVDAMAKIQGRIDEIDIEVKRLTKEIDAKVADLVADIRKTKPTGTVNIEAEGVIIKHSVPKKVAWDQDALADAFEKIEEAGDNPFNYITVKYSVEERKFTAWPDKIKAFFQKARTLKPGKPAVTLKFTEKKEKAA
jgi:hypothetical protein